MGWRGVACQYYVRLYVKSHQPNVMLCYITITIVFLPTNLLDVYTTFHNFLELLLFELRQYLTLYYTRNRDPRWSIHDVQHLN